MASDGSTQFVTVKGKQIIAPDGGPLLLKGIGIGNWLLPEGYMFGFQRANSPRLIDEVICQLVGEERARTFWQTFYEQYVTRDDVHAIVEAGFNHIRVSFNWRLFLTDAMPRQLEGVGWTCLDHVIDWCKAEGLYVILDMHGAPGGQTGDNIDDSWGYPFLYESEESQELTVGLWEALAQRYGDEPIVIGYDLLNEPIATHFERERLNPRLEPLYQRIVTAIRRHDRHHIAFLGGAQWNTNFDVFGPPFESKLAYTFHRYWQEVEPALIQEYLDFRERYDVPLWMGESGENTNEWIAAFRELLEAHNIGWCFWTYKRLDTERCVASIARPDGWDAIVEFANHPRSTYKEVREARPPMDIAAKALDTYLENVRLANCTINQGYLEALGLSGS
jgi:endoglucanase